MVYLVTGGAGFIGSHIVDALIEKGHRVVVVDNFVTGTRKNVHAKARLYTADIRDAKRLANIFKKERPQYVSHHAAQMDVRRSVADPIFDAENNIVGTLRVLALCVAYRVKKIVFASTGGALYGDASILPTPETYPAWPVSPYGVSKITAEKYLYYYHRQHGLRYVALRYGNVYGPRQNPHGEAGVVAIFSKKLLVGATPVINGQGRQTRDYVYVSDVVRANMAAFTRNVVGSVNIGTGKETSVNHLYRILTSAANIPKEAKHGRAKSGEQKRSCLQYSRAKKTLGWHPRVSLEEGLRRTVEWCKE